MSWFSHDYGLKNEVFTEESILNVMLSDLLNDCDSGIGGLITSESTEYSVRKPFKESGFWEPLMYFYFRFSAQLRGCF